MSNRLATDMEVLVSAIKYNYQVELLTPTQFKVFWKQIPNVLTQQECILSLQHTGLIKLAQNVQKFNKLFEIIQTILINDSNKNDLSSTKKNAIKLDNLPMLIVKNISEFLTYVDFLCNLSMTNRYLFISIQSPSYLTHLDFRHCKFMLTQEEVAQTLYNNQHVHWLAIPGYLLKNIHLINYNCHHSITHFAFTAEVNHDDEEALHKPRTVKPPYDAYWNVHQLVQLHQILDNLLNMQTLFKLQDLIFLDITMPSIDIIKDKIYKLLSTCFNLQHLSLNHTCLFDDYKHIPGSLKLSKLKYLTINNWSGSFGVKIIESSDHKIEKLSLNQPHFHPANINAIDKLNLTNLTELDVHLLDYPELYWILAACCSNLRKISMTNFIYHINGDFDENDHLNKTIKSVIRDVIIKCQKLEQLKIKYARCTNETQTKHCQYIDVYEGIYQGLIVKSPSTSKLQIHIAEIACIEQLVLIWAQIQRRLHQISIELTFEGTQIYATKQDWENNNACLSDQEQIMNAIHDMYYSTLNNNFVSISKTKEDCKTKYKIKFDMDT